MGDTSSRSLRVDVGPDQATSAIHYVANDGNRLGATMVLGHGAGGNQGARFLVSLATAFARAGVDVVTFNFLYSAQRRKLPDRPDVLEACYRDVIDRAASLDGTEGNRLFAGGKSMGGRIASQVAAKLDPVKASMLAGLIFFGYPLHPPGRPDKLRTQHLPRVRVPMLFIQGTRDPFGSPAEVQSALMALPGAHGVTAGRTADTEDGARTVIQLGAEATIFEVVGGDHSLAVPRRGHPAGDHIETLVRDVALPWMAGRLGV